MIESLESSEPSDEALLLRIAGGDVAAFENLYDRHAGLIFSLAVRILRNEAEAEDALQEICLMIWERAGLFDARLGRPVSWLITLARNKAIDRLRRSHRKAEVLAAAASDSAVLGSEPRDASRSMIQDEAAGTVRTVLAGLPPEQRVAIELAYFNGLTQAEIADVMKEPLGTIKARIRRGMLQMRDALEGRL